MTNFIFSTLSSDTAYTQYAQTTDGGNNIPLRRVLIRGGVGVAKGKIGQLVTPEGALITEVTDEELEFLRQDYVFNLHLNAGAVRIESKKRDPVKIGANMSKDPSAPKTPSDFPEANVTTENKKIKK